MQVARDRSHSRFERLSGLITGRGAKIQKPLTILQIQKRYDRLRPYILYSRAGRRIARAQAVTSRQLRGLQVRRRFRSAYPRFWTVQSRPCNRLGGVLAELDPPTIQQPSRARQCDGSIRPSDGHSADFPQHRVREPHGGSLVGALHELNAFADGRMLRNPVQMADLVNSHAECNSNIRLQIQRPSSEVIDEEIELSLPS
jgi:hypothetical protein